jgi:hypothetical protein
MKGTTECRLHPEGQCGPSDGQSIALTGFSIPKGTLVEFRQVGEKAWRRHVMQRQLTFDRFARFEDRRYVFRDEGYQLRVHRRFVTHREDGE